MQRAAGVDLAKAATEVENLTKQQNRQQAELTRTTNSLKAAGVDTDKLGSAYADLQQKMTTVAARAAESASAIGKTGSASKEAESKVSGLGKAAAASAAQLASISRIKLPLRTRCFAVQFTEQLIGKKEKAITQDLTE